MVFDGEDRDRGVDIVLEIFMYNTKLRVVLEDIRLSATRDHPDIGNPRTTVRSVKQVIEEVWKSHSWQQAMPPWAAFGF